MGLTVKTIFSGLPQVNANSDAMEIMALRLKTRWGSTLNQHLKPGGREADEHSSREAEMHIGVLQLRQWIIERLSIIHAQTPDNAN